MSWLTILIIIFVVVWLYEVLGGGSSSASTTSSRRSYSEPLHKKPRSPETSELKEKKAPDQSSTPGLSELLASLEKPTEDRSSPSGTLKTHAKSREAEIESFVKENKVGFLVHFTRVENIPAILEHGLLGRTSLRATDVTSYWNDKLRLDNVDNGLSTSISFPNYKMFFRLQMENPNTDWVVIKLNPSVLWEVDCAFCPTNAASRSMTDIPLEQRKGIDSLRQMFADHPEPRTRANLEIPTSFPTDPQAEVLLLEQVKPSYIISVCANERSKIKNFTKLVDIIRPYAEGTRFIHDKTLFYPRTDHRFWANTAQKENSSNDNFDIPF